MKMNDTEFEEMRFCDTAGIIVSLHARGNECRGYYPRVDEIRNYCSNIYINDRLYFRRKSFILVTI